MAWVSPSTVLGRDLVTAALWNQARDNMIATAAGQANTGGRIMCSTGVAAMAERIPDSGIVATLQTTASLTYVDLATVGPAPSRANGVRILVSIGCQMSNGTAGQGARMGYAFSGSNTVAAADTNSVCMESTNAGDAYQISWTTVNDPITPGTITVTGKYRAVGAGTASFSNRNVAFIPF